MPKVFHAHELVVKTAKDLARELYAEVMSQNNELYADWKSACEDLTPAKAEEMFVQMMYPKMIEPARATLGHMLGNPALAHLHETLYDALQKDYLLRAGRNVPQGTKFRPLFDFDQKSGELTRRTRH